MAAKKKVVLITGVTRGLGRAMLEGFGARGHTVAGCGRSARMIKALSRGFPEPHRFSKVDVADDAQVSRWAKDILATLGPPDLLLNNAAIINHNAPLWAVPGREFDALVDVNIKGVANVLRHFVPAMIGAGRGVVVNFSSGWGRSTFGRGAGGYQSAATWAKRAIPFLWRLGPKHNGKPLTVP